MDLLKAAEQYNPDGRKPGEYTKEELLAANPNWTEYQFEQWLTALRQAGEVGSRRVKIGGRVRYVYWLVESKRPAE